MMGGGGAAWSGAGREEEGTGEEEILRQTHHLSGDGRENLCLPKQDYLTREAGNEALSPQPCESRRSGDSSLL